MADIQISEFPEAAPQDSDILHGKRENGEDIKISFENIADEILSRVVIEEQLISEYSTTSVLASNDRVAISDTSTGGENRTVTLAILTSYFGNLYYPVGSYYFNYSNSTNPSTLLGFGTWVQVRGRVIVGQGQGTDVNGTNQTFTAGTTGGEYTHTLSASEIPEHRHFMFGDNQPGSFNEISGTGTACRTSANGRGDEEYRIDEVSPFEEPLHGQTSAIGGSSSHNNVQPYEVAYIWRRTA